MKVSELRNIIKDYNNDDLNNIIVELYKKFPKEKKEEYKIDNYIANVKEEKRIVKEKMGFDEFTNEIRLFIKYANDGLYESYNKVISDKDRQQWRYKVMKYYKELINVDVNIYKGKIATDLLLQLYDILSKGTSRIIFSNRETFRAIQIPQGQFLRTVLKRKMQEDLNKKEIEAIINMLSNGVDNETCYDYLMYIYLNCLKDDEQRLISLEITKNKIIDLQEKLNSDNAKKYSSYEFNVSEEINAYTALVLFLSIRTNQVDDGIKFFYKNYIEKSRETLMYILLGYLEVFELYNEWIREYEKKKINYRDELKEKYEEIKKKTIS